MGGGWEVKISGRWKVEDKGVVRWRVGGGG